MLFFVFYGVSVVLFQIFLFSLNYFPAIGFTQRTIFLSFEIFGCFQQLLGLGEFLRIIVLGCTALKIKPWFYLTRLQGHGLRTHQEVLWVGERYNEGFTH